MGESRESKERREGRPAVPSDRSSLSKKVRREGEVWRGNRQGSPLRATITRPQATEGGDSPTSASACQRSQATPDSFDKLGRPAVPADRPWESLGGGIGVELSADCRFGADALLLARFSCPLSAGSSRRPERRAVDLGTGCGILPLLWCRDNPGVRVEALEIQPEAAEMARRSAERSGLSDRIRVITGDLRRWRKLLEPGVMDLAAMNPPYFREGSGGASLSPAARIARHEESSPLHPGCTLADAAEAAAGLLRPGGRFCLCHRPERLADVLAVLRAAGLEPKRLRFVQAGAETAPWLFLCEGKKGGRPGLAVEPTLIEHHG